MNIENKLSLEEIKARIQVVCICKGIKMSRMCDAIAKGASTVAQVHRATKSGDGGCGATRCTPVIEALLANNGRPLTNLDKIRSGQTEQETSDDELPDF
jgi:NAD(P)H-nitrite reductase large subunit